MASDELTGLLASRFKCSPQEVHDALAPNVAAVREQAKKHEDALALLARDREWTVSKA